MDKLVPFKWNITTEENIIGDNVLFQTQCSSNQCQGQCRKADPKKRPTSNPKNDLNRSTKTDG